MIITYIAKTPPPDEWSSDDRVLNFTPMPQSLTSFVARTMIKDSTHIIFNLIGTEFSNPHILSAVQMLNQYTAAEIIIIKEKNDNTDELFLSVQNFNIKHLIAADEMADIEKEVAQCLDEKRGIHNIAKVRAQAMRAAAMKNADINITIPKGMVLSIAIIGAVPRIGATTQAIGIYHFLKIIGFEPVIVDKTGFTETYVRYQRDSVKMDNFLNIENVRFDVNEHLQDETVSANIFDFGTDVSNNMAEIMSADLVVVVSGTKLNEIVGMSKVAAELEAVEDGRLINIISFVESDEFMEMSNSLRGTSHMAEWKPSLWSEDNAVYNEILYAEIKNICMKA